MNQERATLLINACFESLEKASELLDVNPDLIFEKTGLGETPLHYLAVENQLDAVEFLFLKGADLNTKNEFGDTPITEATSLGHFDMVKFLLENGAKIDQLPGGDPIIHEAVRSGDPEIVDLLVNYGVDINATDFLGCTPLHESASEDEFLDVTKYLVNKGVNIDALDGFNCTPLNASALHGCLETAKFLVSSGASLTIKDAKGRTPAEKAMSCNNLEIEDYLKQAEEKHQIP